MINWMQKHKKYLIPTIWVSTIAFVGAGFVGWGAYDMNKDRSTSVAKVGEIAINIKEFQQKYSELFSYIKSTSGDEFNEETAKNMHLDEAALASLIQETILLNFARDLGIRVNKDDIAKYIVNSPNFQENGKFSENLYRQSLKNVGINPSEYEKSLEKAITLSKLQEALKLVPTEKIIEAVSAAEFMQDRVSLQVISQSVDEPKFSDDELKAFWEKNKNNYLTKRTFEIDTLFVKPQNFEVEAEKLKDFYDKNRSLYVDENGKFLDFEIAKEQVIKDFLADFNKDEAIKVYLEVKKGKTQTNEKMVVSNENFEINELQNAKIGEVNKPIAYKDGNLITRVTKINEPEVMDFQSAKDLAKLDFIAFLKQENLKKSAESALVNFDGKDIGFISKASENKTEILTDNEFGELLLKIFSSKDKQGYALTNDKALVYKITDQNLSNPEMVKNYGEILKTQVAKILNSNLEQDLISALQKRYEIKRYYKGSSVE